MLRESAMCPDGDKTHFEDITRHMFFNTNNLWVNLPALKVCEGAGKRRWRACYCGWNEGQCCTWQSRVRLDLSSHGIEA
jgi:hypothetical protein